MVLLVSPDLAHGRSRVAILRVNALHLHHVLIPQELIGGTTLVVTVALLDLLLHLE